MTMDKYDQPAFATQRNHIGLTRLDYVSAMALQGILSSISNPDMAFHIEQNAKRENVSCTEFVAGLAVATAKELLNQLEKEK